MYQLIALSLLLLSGCDKQQQTKPAEAPTSPPRQGEAGVSSAGRPTPPDDQYDILVARATQYVSEWNKEERLCDQIEGPGLDSVKRGKVTFIASAGGKIDPPIPGVVAQVTGTCVIDSLRKREPLQRVWIMMAYDKSFNTFRCVKIGGEPLIKSFIEKNCEFVEEEAVQNAATEQQNVATGATTSSLPSLPPNRVASYLQPFQGSFSADCSGSSRITVKGEIVTFVQDGKPSLLKDPDIIVSWYGRDQPPKDFNFVISGTDSVSGRYVPLFAWDGSKGPEISIESDKAPRLARCP
jgi:hypothetical protein